jgi:hypothetical protein
VTLPVAAARAVGGARAAGAARASAGARTAAARRPPIPDPRVTAPGSEAARHREAVEQIKAKRPAEVDEDLADEQTESPAPASPRAGLSVAADRVAASTGSGFLLGLFVWACARAYLGDAPGGMAGVGEFLAAKFLNKSKGA